MLEGDKDQDQNWTMLEGDRLNLTCLIIAGLPKPKVSWYKQKMLLVDKESTSLILEKLTDRDEGQYKCEARNPGGVAYAIMNVIVDGKSREFLVFLPWDIYGTRRRSFIFMAAIVRRHKLNVLSHNGN